MSVIKYITHGCITLHMHAYPFNLFLPDTGKDRGVCSLTEEQGVSWR